jgi:hypothetical protein
VHGELSLVLSFGEPVSGQRIYYQTSGYVHDLSVVTDANGRYSFCGLPPERATLQLFCTNDNSVGNVTVIPRGDMTVDIDATSFKGCL